MDGFYETEKIHPEALMRIGAKDLGSARSLLCKTNPISAFLGWKRGWDGETKPNKANLAGPSASARSKQSWNSNGPDVRNKANLRGCRRLSIGNFGLGIADCQGGRICSPQSVIRNGPLWESA